jgi:Restriction endonuclease
MWPAFPVSDYYRASAPPDVLSRRRACPSAVLAARGEGDTGRFLHGLNVCEGFALSTESRHIGEQIDGLVELGSRPYRVEAKWAKNPLGVDGVAQHLVRVYSRPGVHGLIVWASEFADTTVQRCRHALTRRLLKLCS